MIRITKPPATAAMNRRSDRALATLLRRHASSESHRSGLESHAFNARVYGHDEVRRALIEAQRGKCAFCESKFTHIAYGDVEHFRPKAAFRQSTGEPLTRPGYYWLAYSWENLLASCTLCNQRFKENLFPLADPSRRVRTHDDDLSRERPLLLNPETDAIEAHLTFEGEMPTPVRGSRRGKRTIETLGLDRPELIEERLARRRIIGSWLECRQLLRARFAFPYPVDVRAQLESLDRLLEHAMQPDAPFSAMARAMIEG